MPAAQLRVGAAPKAISRQELYLPKPEMSRELPNLLPSLALEHYRGLAPLIYSHINPYGAFDLDLSQRIDLDVKAAA